MILNHFLVLSKKLFRTADQRLGQLEADDGGIEPVKVRSLVLGLVDQRIEKFVLPPLFIAEDVLLRSLIEYQLSLWSFHANAFIGQWSVRLYKIWTIRRAIYAVYGGNEVTGCSAVRPWKGPDKVLRWSHFGCGSR